VSFFVVLPYNYRPWFDECIATLETRFVLAVDNTQVNKGVAASWNMGIDMVRLVDAEWLIIMSAAMRFGQPGGQDFIDALEGDFVAAAGESLAYAEDKCDFHLAAISRRALDVVGRFDQNFWPAYWEDVDFNHRARLALPDHTVKHVPIDGYCKGVNHGVELGGALRDTSERRAYMLAKWGDLSSPIYQHPFNNPELPPDYWPESHDGGRWDA
jgi:hypothetical protein